MQGKFVHLIGILRLNTNSDTNLSDDKIWQKAIIVKKNSLTGN